MVVVIDWITARFPCRHETPIGGSVLTCHDPDTGAVEWSSQKWRQVPSHATSVQVRTFNAEWAGGGWLEISGNPAKWFQGHNVFGTDDVQGLCVAFFRSVARALGLSPSADNLAAWDAGEYSLQRVDIAQCFRLPSPADVRSWLLAAHGNLHGRHQGVSAYGGETVYIGQHSRRISLKFYDKYQEMLRHRRGLSEHFEKMLLEHSKGLLRAELVIRSMELKKRGLNTGKAWTPDKPRTLLQERIGTMSATETVRLSDSELEALSPASRAAYVLWRDGHDLRDVYTRRTFYRHRAALRKVGIDLSTRCPRGGEVVPLVRFLRAEEEAVAPAHFKALGLLWEPRRAA